MAEPIDYQARLKQALAAMQKMRARLDALEQARTEPIAIIGIGCRFPGGVRGPEAYWNLLHNGIDAITETPPDRQELRDAYDPDPGAPGKTYARHGGFLDGLDQFDPQFFGIAPREGNSLDPQQRLFLEVAWEALEHANVAPDKLVGTQTGVFLGITASDYLQLHVKYMDAADINAYLVAGNVPNVTPGRLSYTLGLHGPSIALDTACSSSLSAIHLACLSIRAGDSAMAIAGGVNVLLAPEVLISLSKWGMLSPEGRCKTFDARADGFVRGEGCGVVVLKPLSAALSDGDNILALIRGSATNQDGASSGLTVPNGLAQEAVIRAALANAGVEPHAIRYVETHGTGTTLGDPIEVEAIGEALCRNRPTDQPLAIGSVKTNLGHLEAASGVAGLIKTVLALYHEEIPPHLHLQERSPFINWADLPIEIPNQPTVWPRGDRPRLAGVSSFGFSGTNVHVILEEAPQPTQSETPTPASRPFHLLTLSAKSENALREAARRHSAFLDDNPTVSLPEVGATTRHGRAHFSHRLGLVAASAGEASEKLAAFAAGGDAAAVVYGQTGGQTRPKVVFLFPGQGAQYLGMGRQLYETEPVFRAALDRCDELLRPYLNTSLLAIIFADPASEGSQRTIDDTFYTQPATFAVEYALAELWRSWGVEPDAAMGHSMGEYVAACAAGVFSLEDGLKLVAARGRLMRGLPLNGAMAVVFADQSTVAAAIAPYGDAVAIAAINGPENIVISGLATAVESVLESYQSGGIKVRRLAISHASHSALMEPMLDEFEAVAATIAYATPRIDLVSNLTGRSVNGGEIDAAYFRRHIRQPVRFAESMALLHERGYQLFLEASPTPTLLSMGERCLPEGAGVWLPSLRKGREDWPQMLQSLATLYAHGAPVDWAAFDEGYVPAERRRRLDLPTYPFQRQRYWLDVKKPRRRPTAHDGHRLIGCRLRSPAVKEIVFESQLSAPVAPFLADHQVMGLIVVPATAYVEMALAAAAEAFGPGARTIEDAIIHEALILGKDEERPAQVVLAGNAEEAAFQIFSLPAQGQHGQAWQLHAAGKIRPERATGNEAELSLADAQGRCREEVAIDEHYRGFERRGIAFGPAFRGVARLWRGADEALGQIQLPATLAAEANAYHFHPALLDACWQVFGATWSAPTDPSPNGHACETSIGELDTYMPVGLEGFRFYRPPGDRLWSHARLRPAPPAPTGDGRETITGDLRLYDESGRLVAEAEGLTAKRATRDALHRALRAAGAPERWRDWLYEIVWRARPHPSRAAEQLPASNDQIALTELSERLQPRVAELAAHNGLTGSAELLPQLDALSVAYALLAFEKLGYAFTMSQRVTVDVLAQVAGIAGQHHALLRRILGVLAEEGILLPEGDGWVVAAVPTASDPQARLTALAQRYPAYAGEIDLFGRCVANLAEVLRGELEPLQLLFPPNAAFSAEYLYGDAPTARTYNTLLAEAVAAAVVGMPAGRQLRILEIGAGTGGATSYILPHLPAGRVEYTFTDLSNLFLVKAKEKFSDYPFIDYRLLDIERDPARQGFAPHSLDLIIAANVFHATGDLRRTLAHARQLLAPNGALALLEGVAPRRWIDLTFGLTAGWWKFTDKTLRPAHPLLSPEQWRALLAAEGFREAATVPDADADALFPQAVILARAPRTDPAREAGTWLLFADDSGVARGLGDLLRERGANALCVAPGQQYERLDEAHWRLDPAEPDHFRRLLADVTAEAGAPRGVVHLWSLDAALNDASGLAGLAFAQDRAARSALHLAQAVAGAALPAAPRLWYVTGGAQAVAGTNTTQPAQAPLWGLGKIVALEHPEIFGGCIDVDPAAGDARAQLAALLTEMWSPEGENQVALRGGERYVARLVRSGVEVDSGRQPANWPEPVRLAVATPGILDSLELRPLARRAPGPGEVEIEVVATGLNFRDVLNAMGLYPGDAGPLGGECAGRIVTVGAGVAGFAPGDEVIALAAGSFGSFVTARAESVVHKPPRLSLEAAATVLSAFLTAHYTLHHLAGLSAGERVLIHAAAGGVGMAAVQVARRAGAEVFATAGSPEKRELLRSMGVQHIMNSRTLDFADEIARFTGGRGVDVVLNSLAEEFVPRSLSALADNGRFVEIGKRGIWTAEQVSAVKPHATYYIVDLAAKSGEEPALTQSLLREIVALVDADEFQPLPYQVFPLAEAASAFRAMAQGKHTGKIVVTHPPAGAGHNERPPVRADATYLITGGLTGLGLLVAQRLVGEGARHLVLMGRRAPTDAARAAIQALEATGAAVMVAQGDVSDEARLRQVLAHIENEMPPLRGVIHSAGVLDDGALLQQNWSRFQTVFAPKVGGGYLLHTLTRGAPLDFFILFSSGSAVLGSPGQSNHAAANAFLDAMAHYRRGMGLPALSVNWGVWAEIGAAAERSVGDRASSRGIGQISPEEGWQALWHLMQQSAADPGVSAQVGVFPVDWAKFLAGGAPPFFRELAVTGPSLSKTAGDDQPRLNGRAEPAPGAPVAGQGTRLRQRLEEAPASKRRMTLLAYVRDEANKVLGLPSMQSIDNQQPLQELGLDSLMAVELRNLLGSSLELERPLPATLVFDYPTVESLADYLMNELYGRQPESDPVHSGSDAARAKKVSELEALSEDEAEAMLLAELAAMKKK
jgi:acyl transferase domain-containing protein